MSTTSTPLTPNLNSFIRKNFSAEDDFLRQLLLEAKELNIPEISIAPEQTGFLQVLLRAVNARNVLEIGSLAGYSAISMARALPPDGTLYACELDPRFCDFIRNKAEQANLANVIKVVEGPALITYPATRKLFTEPLDVVFIDADKLNYTRYLEMVLPDLRKGGLVIADNALAWGLVADENPISEPQNVIALRTFNERLSSHPELQATLVPLGDGMAIGVKL
ncbi:MAG: O-methyltransferase [Ignavibacteria bacterium]|nr:O-methyltransferase [Ignavibacteria bacterium]